MMLPPTVNIAAVPTTERLFMSIGAPTRLGRRGRWTLAGIGLAIVALMAVANAHLVYVALATQPECVPHLKTPDDSGVAFRAAKSAC